MADILSSMEKQEKKKSKDKIKDIQENKWQENTIVSHLTNDNMYYEWD